MPNNPDVAAVVEEYLAAHPTLPSRQLARIMYKEHSLLWSGYDAAYSAIRYRRGAKGKVSREDRGLTEPTTPMRQIPASVTRLRPL